MSDTNDDARARHQRALLHNAPKAAPRIAQPGELLCEFYSERLRKFYRIILRDRGQDGVEAQDGRSQAKARSPVYSVACSM